MGRKNKKEETFHNQDDSQQGTGRIIAIACRTGDHVIGNKGQIPWSCPEDMKFFQETTKGHIVVMGRRTYESIGHDLEDRMNIVMTRDPDILKKRYPESKALFTDKMMVPNKGEEMYVIGGHSIYQLYAPYTDDLLLSTIYINGIEGDCFMAPGGNNYVMHYKGHKEVTVKYTDSQGQQNEQKCPYDIIEYHFIRT